MGSAWFAFFVGPWVRVSCSPPFLCPPLPPPPRHYARGGEGGVRAPRRLSARAVTSGGGAERGGGRRAKPAGAFFSNRDAMPLGMVLIKKYYYLEDTFYLQIKALLAKTNTPGRKIKQKP